LRIVATEAGQVHAVELPRAGQHDVRNLLAALCIGRALGVELEAMLARVSTLSPVPRRLEPKLAKNGVAILDDTYNANPESLLAALTVLDASTVATARVLVLGDMLELGDDAAAIHAVVGEQLVGRVDRLVTVGSLAAQAGEAFVELTGNAGGWTRFDDVDQVSSVLPELFQSGDLVLFKASRGVALDRAVDALVGSA
jgi:UDP-N-acetylmuramoyl-tripeptide--D-alanyl-D-alanine ligase